MSLSHQKAPSPWSGGYIHVAILVCIYNEIHVQCIILHIRPCIRQAYTHLRVGYTDWAHLHMHADWPCLAIGFTHAVSSDVLTFNILVSLVCMTGLHGIHALMAERPGPRISLLFSKLKRGPFCWMIHTGNTIDMHVGKVYSQSCRECTTHTYRSPNTYIK